MCTLVAFISAWHGSPLVIAANRDERLDRAASGPTRWVGERFFAPRDDQAGGSWLGLHDSGLFVGVTNRAGTPRNPALVSRGRLVVEALRLGGAAKVHHALSTTLDARRYFISSRVTEMRPVVSPRKGRKRAATASHASHRI
jgi:uncharacterized protein with NRDE domain